MSDISARIPKHYATGSLLARIEAGLAELGKDLSTCAPEDLKPVDEFHIGGIAATEALLDQLPLRPGMRALDIGAGIGGTARVLAARGLVVHGVDLTEEFVLAARRLCSATGIEASFETGDALALPLGDDSFDLATLIHVGMNIPDKARLFAETARVLRPGGVFAVYDVMAGEPGKLGALSFPLPWADGPEMSFLAPPGTYRDAAREAGFRIEASRDRGDFARAFFERLSARMAEHGPPPIGLPLIMGKTAPAKIANMIEALAARRIAPVELICRLAGGSE